MTKSRPREVADEVAGRICKALVPIRKEYYLGRAKSPAICTLSSINLLEQISRTDAIMDRIAIVGRLLSENKGIDTIISFGLDHPELHRIILCGREVKGHLAGQAMLALSKNGIDADGNIIGASGPYPTLHTPARGVDRFRRQVEISDLIGLTNVDSIVGLVS